MPLNRQTKDNLSLPCNYLFSQDKGLRIGLCFLLVNYWMIHHTLKSIQGQFWSPYSAIHVICIYKNLTLCMYFVLCTTILYIYHTVRKNVANHTYSVTNVSWSFLWYKCIFPSLCIILYICIINVNSNKQNRNNLRIL
jgi:hypothetical protein